MYSYTRLPNFVVDDYLDDLSPHELKVYIYILRRTEGFQKETDQIPLSQFMYGIVTKAGKRLDKGVGLKRRQVLYAIKLLEERGLITVERDGHSANIYGVQKYAPGSAEKCTPPARNPAPINIKNYKRQIDREKEMEETAFRVINY